MSNATLDRPETDVTPFTLFWAEKADNDVTSESDWAFSEPTQGLSSFSASSADKPYGSPPPNGGDGGDVMCRFG